MKDTVHTMNSLSVQACSHVKVAKNPGELYCMGRTAQKFGTTRVDEKRRQLAKEEEDRRVNL